MPTSTTTPQATIIIAHRGASHDAPENTLPAVQLAWQQGADAVEIDVRLTQDGHIVVLHDAGLQRVAGMARLVAEHPLAELQQFDLGRWKAPHYAGTRIPTLDDVMAAVPAGQRLFIEVKCGPEITAPLAATITHSVHPSTAFAIIAFDATTLSAIKRALPDIETAWLASCQPQQETGTFNPSPANLIAQATELGFDGLDLHFRGPIYAALVARMRDVGLKCYVWTVNDAVAARHLSAAGVAGITTDRPGWLRAQLED